MFEGQQESPIGNPKTLTSVILSRIASNMSVVFIYTCPPQSKIRERMIYAASRGSVVASAEADAGLKIAKRVSIRNTTACFIVRNSKMLFLTLP